LRFPFSLRPFRRPYSLLQLSCSSPFSERLRVYMRWLFWTKGPFRASHKSPGQKSEVRTEALQMELDHDSGHMERLEDRSWLLADIPLALTNIRLGASGHDAERAVMLANDPTQIRNDNLRCWLVGIAVTVARVRLRGIGLLPMRQKDRPCAPIRQKCPVPRYGPGRRRGCGSRCARWRADAR
jgi:hypothetical protein